MKKYTIKRYLPYILGIVFFFLIWEMVSLIINEPILIFPNPFDTISYSFYLLGNSNTYIHLGATLLRILIGFGISLLAALLLGTISGNYPYIQKIFQPTIVALKAIPTAAMVFVFLVLVGFDNAPILMVILIAFPLLYDSVVAGFNNIPLSINESLAIERKATIHKILQVKLPLSSPYIFVSIASTFALTFKVAVMAEIMIGSSGNGIGTIIRLERTLLHTSDMRPVFAYSFIIILLVLLFSGMSTFIKKRYQIK